MIVPVVLGKGRTMFEGIDETVPFEVTQSRVFPSGRVFLRSEPKR